MHWENFFDDLEGQLEQELFEDEHRRSQVEERFRMSVITLRDRVAAVGGAELPRSQRPEFRIEQPGYGIFRLRLLTVGRDWFSAERLGQGRTIQMVMDIKKMGAIVADHPFPLPVADLNNAQLASRISYGFFLRDLARRRSTVKAFLHPEQAVTGTVDQVSRDHCELVLHDAEGRRLIAPERRMLIPFSQLDFLEL